jgi:peptidoglycan/LPS O-acetylase OafA/YrhL
LPRNAAMVAVMAGITWISTISYSLYLVNHTLVRELLFRSRVFSEGLFHAAPGHLAAALAQYTLYLAVSFAAAYVVWLAVEKPVMAYREKWWR